ncbi:PilZ domain-containing protein [Erythrobacter mangrovi]|uniref:PilZ domain-containing protein n=1 Tax=Erythrobacter mangrovi TaxID=2739433 RepID=A0A7D3XUA9_9SPHN|nr:PilZ domain-containing protein [Erythrobacter mangrovi]QKG70676.1 PilZ domain-containing protein [Erythrobacter mangrovi]
MERRKEQRRNTSLAVIARVGGIETPCEMRNLSQSGCMMACTRILAEVGSPIEIELARGLVVPGEVSWQMGESVGVFFLEPIPMAVVSHFALDDWMFKADWSLSGSGLESGG